jgi:hypothetical protein
MAPKHARTGTTHHVLHRRSLRRAIAMDAALAAGGLLRTERAACEPLVRVVEKAATRLAQLSRSRAVHVPAEDADHGRNSACVANDVPRTRRCREVSRKTRHTSLRLPRTAQRPYDDGQAHPLSALLDVPQRAYRFRRAGGIRQARPPPADGRLQFPGSIPRRPAAPEIRAEDGGRARSCGDAAESLPEAGKTLGA